MNKILTRDPFRVGIIAIVVGALVGGLILLLSVASFGTRTYTAHLAQTAGLRKTESVEVAGVTSGKVTGIRLGGDDVVVTFTLDKDIHLGNDTTASVEVSTLLGTHFLAIDPKGTGSITGDSIPLSHTTVPFNLQDVIDKGTTGLNKLDPKLIAKALTTASDVFDKGRQQIGPALDGITRISAVVAKRSDEIGALLVAARQVTDQLSSSSGDLITLMKSSNLVIGELVRRKAAIGRLFVNVQSLSQSLHLIVKNTKGDLGPALKDLDTVLTILKDKKQQLATALHQLGLASRYFANATGNGQWLDLYVPDGIPDDSRCSLDGSGCS